MAPPGQPGLRSAHDPLVHLLPPRPHVPPLEPHDLFRLGGELGELPQRGLRDALVVGPLQHEEVAGEPGEVEGGLQGSEGGGDEPGGRRPEGRGLQVEVRVEQPRQVRPPVGQHDRPEGDPPLPGQPLSGRGEERPQAVAQEGGAVGVHRRIRPEPLRRGDHLGGDPEHRPAGGPEIARAVDPPPGASGVGVLVGDQQVGAVDGDEGEGLPAGAQPADDHGERELVPGLRLRRAAGRDPDGSGLGRGEGEIPIEARLPGRRDRPVGGVADHPDLARRLVERGDRVAQVLVRCPAGQGRRCQDDPRAEGNPGPTERPHPNPPATPASGTRCSGCVPGRRSSR